MVWDKLSRAGNALADPRLLKPGEVTERPGESSKLLKLAFSPLLPAVAAQAKAFGMQNLEDWGLGEAQ